MSTGLKTEVLVILDFFPEEAAEEKRLTDVKRFRIARRWFTPTTVVKAESGRQLVFAAPKREYLVKRGDAELTNEEVASRPLYHNELSNDSLTDRMAVYFLLNPTNVYTLYTKAVSEKRMTIAELVPAVLRQLASGGALSSDALKQIRGTFSMINKKTGCPVAKDIVVAVS